MGFQLRHRTSALFFLSERSARLRPRHGTRKGGVRSHGARYQRKELSLSDLALSSERRGETKTRRRSRTIENARRELETVTSIRGLRQEYANVKGRKLLLPGFDEARRAVYICESNTSTLRVKREGGECENGRAEVDAVARRRRRRRRRR